MATQSAPVGQEPAAKEVQKLREQLARLQAANAIAQYDIEKMGFSLDAARKAGWVSRRAESRQRRRREERRKAEEAAAKQAELKKNRKWVREEHKKLGDLSPTPFEKTCRAQAAEAAKRVRAEQLRGRVQRASNQLLIAAAMGKQYSETTTGADRAVPLRYTDFDERSDEGKKTIGSFAFRATADMLGVVEDDNANDTVHELADLDLEDLSDEVVTTAYAMMAMHLDTAGSPDSLDDCIVVDWADTMARDIIGKLGGQLITPPGTPGKDGKKTRSHLPDRVLAALKKFIDVQKPVEKQVPDPSNKKTQGMQTEPDRERYDNGKGPSGQKPNTPARPNRNVFDPKRWQPLPDADDGSWVREEKVRRAHKQLQTNIETGFVTWAEQEARFPYLDQRLYLHDVTGPDPIVFDPTTVDTRVWDPFNRAITEPKTGKRASLRLNPITGHSILRWVPSEFSDELPLDPSELPENPSTEDKKRPLPSASLVIPKKKKVKKARRARNTTKKARMGQNGTGLVNTGVMAKFAVPLMKKTSSSTTSESAPLASVHYPLKSPTATSIPNPHPRKANDGKKNAVAMAHLAIARPSPPGPPTPYPRRIAMSETPTVALYEHHISTTEEFMSYISEVEDEESEHDDEVEPFLKSINPGPQLHSTAGPATWSLSSYQIDNKSINDKKRPAQLDFAEPPSARTKKRRTTITSGDINDGTSDSSAEKNVAKPHSPTPIRAHAANIWLAQGVEGVEDVENVAESSSDETSSTTSQAQDKYEQLGMEMGEYDEEELQTAHPVPMREYYAARAELARIHKPGYKHDRATERFDRAKSQLKAVLNEESAAKSAKAWDLAAAQDAVDVEAKRGLGEQQQPASALSNRYGQRNPYHPHHLPQTRLDPSKVVKTSGEFPPKPKSVRFASQGHEGPTDVMRHEARRAVGRLDLTSSRRGSLGPYR